MLRPQLNIILDSHDANVFRSAKRKLNLSDSALMKRIIEDWARHPARRPGNTVLPPENSVLYHGERLVDFVRRIKNATVLTVLTQEQFNFSRTAKRLGFDRSSFFRLFCKLKPQKEETLTAPVSFSNETSNLDLFSDFPSLADAIKRHSLCALELSKGDKEQAAHLTAISTAQLDQIVQETAILWVSSANPISLITNVVKSNNQETQRPQPPSTL